MPRLRWSQHALRDVARLHAFLVPKSAEAASHAVAVIRKGVSALATHPEIGRTVEELPPEFREWVIEFGQGAYVVLYRYDGSEAVILAVATVEKQDIETPATPHSCSKPDAPCVPGKDLAHPKAQIPTTPVTGRVAPTILYSRC